uniref:AXH domain-containing protein n=1 Tax=Ciona savignyi TaxID=51511 RepID=H2YRU7_CIOSA
MAADNGSNTGLYPAHFKKGALIQLANGQIKKVEELNVEDFQQSTELSNDLKLDVSTVAKIEIDEPRSLALLCFFVGNEKLVITVEAPVEHPFFVYGKGWCSVSPDRSMARYALVCQHLSVGNKCASLTLKPPPENQLSSTVVPSRIIAS